MDAAVNGGMVDDLIGFGVTVSALLTGILAAILAATAFDVPLLVAFVVVFMAVLVAYALMLAPLTALRATCATTFIIFHADRALLRDETHYDELCITFDKMSKSAVKDVVNKMKRKVQRK